jgi:hypothetical protein
VNPDIPPPRQSSAPLFLLVLAVILLLGQFAAGLLFAPPGHDGSYYLAQARYVSRGLTPVRDFPTPYAPGAYYLSAWVGEGRLADTFWGKVPMYLAHLANLILVYLILLRLGHRHVAALLGAVAFGLWVVACGGDRLFLEPFQNTFALLAFALLICSRAPWVCALAGLAAGGALMIKQLSLPLVPGLLILALAPSAAPGRPADRSWAGRLIGAAAFLVCNGVPFLAYALLTRQDVVAAFLHLTSFGRQAGEYGNFGWREIYAGLVEHPAPGLMPLYPSFALGAWCLVRERSWEAVALVALLAGGFLVLFVQPHVHYAQLCAPWGVLLMAEGLRNLGRPAEAGTAQRLALGTLVLLWFLPGVVVATRESVRYFKHRPADQLKTIADQVASRLPSRDNVLIVNGPWLYLLDDITPPDREHGFIRGKDIDRPWVLDLARKCDYAVVMPYGHTGRFPMDNAREEFKKLGLTEYDALPVDTEILGEEPANPDAKILFFRRAPGGEGK